MKQPLVLSVIFNPDTREVCYQQQRHMRCHTRSNVAVRVVAATIPAAMSCMLLATCTGPSAGQKLGHRGGGSGVESIAGAAGDCKGNAS